MLQIKKIHPNAQLPTRGSQYAIGYDLYANEKGCVCAHHSKIIPTGIAIQMPEGCYGRIAPRSSLARDYWINVGAGVIDSDYRGEIKICLFNHGTIDFHYNQGDRIAQLILEKAKIVPVVEVDTLDVTERNSNGFGSTNIPSK